jgi:hypothetical protein
MLVPQRGQYQSAGVMTLSFSAFGRSDYVFRSFGLSFVLCRSLMSDTTHADA